LSLASIAESMVKATPFMQASGDLITAATKMTPEASTSAEKVFKAAADLAKIEVSSDNTALLDALASLTNAVGQNNANIKVSRDKQIEVVVQMDGKEMYRAMQPYRDKDIR